MCIARPTSSRPKGCNVRPESRRWRCWRWRWRRRRDADDRANWSRGRGGCLDKQGVAFVVGRWHQEHGDLDTKSLKGVTRGWENAAGGCADDGALGRTRQRAGKCGGRADADGGSATSRRGAAGDRRRGTGGMGCRHICIHAHIHIKHARARTHTHTPKNTHRSCSR